MFSPVGFIKSRLFLLSSLTAIIGLFFLFPLDYLLGIGPYWANPGNEVNVALAGLRYYMSEAIGFPLGHISSINAPEGVNILYTSAVPLTSFIAKLIYHATAININAIYVWNLVCTAMQGIAFSYLLYALGIRDLYLITISSLVAMIMPCYLIRLESAVAIPLFLLILAIAFYFQTRKTHGTRAVLASGITVSLSYLINPYITAMLIPFLGISILNALQAHQITWQRALVISASVILSMIMIAGIFGYFYGNKVTGNAGGYDFFSMNLQAPFDLGQSTLFKLWFPDTQPANATGGQQEGMQYLGAGVLLMIISAIFIARFNIFKAIKRHYWLSSLMLGFTLFSLSNKIYWGNSLLLHYPLPSFLEKITGIFRASGRFFWPVSYFLLAISILAIVRRFPKAAGYLLTFALCLQMADTHELRLSLWHTLSGLNSQGEKAGKYQSPYQIGGVSSVLMHNLLKNHQHLKMYPSWWCGGVGNQLFEIELSYIGSLYSISQNSYYSARANKNCYQEDKEARTLSQLAPGTLYVFGQRYADLKYLHSQGIDLSSCRILNHFEVLTNINPLYLKNAPIVCSTQIKSGEIDFNTQFFDDKPEAASIDSHPYEHYPVIQMVTASGSFNNDLYNPLNLLSSRINENDYIFPTYWMAPPDENGWIRFDLAKDSRLAKIRVLNTRNAHYNDRMSKTVKIELINSQGKVVYMTQHPIALYPHWTTITVPSIPTRAVKVTAIKADKASGAGLNKVELIAVD